MKKEEVFISHVLFPWETFADQAKREQREIENGGARWTEEFLQEVRENVLRYANEPFFSPKEYKHADIMNKSMRNSSLNDVYNLVPFHFRERIFEGIYFPIFDRR